MLLTNKTVAIIGAGPVGLTMARLLQQKGACVTVYERDKDANARIWGGTLDLHENTGQQALQAAGLLDRYFALAIPMGRTITDEQGNVLRAVKPDDDNPEINRNNLRSLLLDSLANDTVVWDRKFIGLEPHDGRWRLHFEHKPDAIADVVIGANGGLSKVREYVTDAGAALTGSFIIQGEVARPETDCSAFYQLCDDNILMTTDRGVSVVANPNNNGALTYNVMFKTPDAWRDEVGLNFEHKDSVAIFLSNMLSHWHDCYHQLFRATSFFVGLPTRRLSLDSPWKSHRPLPITLVGDAAHIMPPFAGEGVNTGLMDALLLCRNLTAGGFETLDAAISAYEHDMFIYAAEAQRQTRKNEIDMHRPDFSFIKRFSQETA